MGVWRRALLGLAGVVAVGVAIAAAGLAIAHRDIEAIDPPSATGSGEAGQTNVWLTGNHMALFELIRTSTSQGEGGHRWKLLQVAVQEDFDLRRRPGLWSAGRLAAKTNQAWLDGAVVV